MPIKEDEVIKTLNDHDLNRISFSVGQIKVNAEQFRKVADSIRAGDITVIPGTDTDAFYGSHFNDLITQQGDPPLNPSDRAQLLHECTHAIVDINKWKVLQLHGEVAAYLTQMTYMLIKNPAPMPTEKPPPDIGPQARLILVFKEIVLKYGLNETRGFGAAINPKDIARLVEVVHAHPDYAGVSDDQMIPEKDLGVPDEHLKMQRQVLITDSKTGRAAVKPINRPRRKPAPRMRLR